MLPALAVPSDLDITSDERSLPSDLEAILDDLSVPSDLVLSAERRSPTGELEALSSRIPGGREAGWGWKGGGRSWDLSELDVVGRE